jgi:DNA-binding transcriptional LysR family regulator
MVARIIRRPLLEIRYVGIARRNHPALRKRLSIGEFAALPHIAISPRGGPPTFVDELLTETGIRRNTVLTIPHFLAAAPIVARTDLVAIIDLSIARLFSADRSLQTFELPIRLRPIWIDMLMAGARAEESALKWLHDQCVEVAGLIAPDAPEARKARLRA